MTQPWIDPTLDHDALASAAIASGRERRAMARRRARILGATAVLVLVVGVVVGLSAASDDDDVSTDDSTSTTTDRRPGIHPTPADSTAPGDSTTSTTTSATGTSIIAGPGPGHDGTDPASATTPTSPGTAPQPIRIGTVGTWSIGGGLEPALASGRELLDAWVRQVNAAGGLAGHPVELVVGDDQGDSGRHDQLVRDLVEQEGVVAFVANLAPFALTAGTTNYLEEAGVPVIGGDSLSPAWHNSPALFPVGSGIAGQAAALVASAKHLYGSELAIVACVESTYCTASGDLAASLASGLGVTVTYRGSHSLVAPDYESTCRGAVQSGADAVVLFFDANATARFDHNCGLPILTGTFGAITGPTSEGIRSVLPILPWTAVGLPGADEFHSLLQSSGLAPGYATSMAFASAELLERSSTSVAWPNVVTAADIRRGLDAVDGDTLGGLTSPRQFTLGQATADDGCAFPVISSGGSWIPADFQLC